MCDRRASWALLLNVLLTVAGLAAPASAQPQVLGSPIRSLLENGAGRLLWIYDGIRHVELPLDDGKAVIGLSCERQTWTVFTIERGGKEVYSFREDPAWGYQPAGPIAASRLCTAPVRVAE
ncbi:hypothetical protein I1E95_11855 [Synechococcus sp. CBW1107]|uniref:hypothetical protein n=1 Tax=Synechococcus sp. CBW1107 TaxID=2789857 RepID=UPI0018CF75CD|nr:hypothetical protein [Synechococcus sp. CBW1107]QPN55843.1 hypothetical protein I1E95_11855 [Synechococcus sp. CBW1107]